MADETVDDLVVQVQSLQTKTTDLQYAVLRTSAVKATVLTYADAQVQALSLPTGSVIRVLQDETYPGYMTWYRVTSADGLEFVISEAVASATSKYGTLDDAVDEAVAASAAAVNAAADAQTTSSTVTYLTEADMRADTTQPANTVARVTTGTGSGYYVYDGSAWVWSDLQPADAADLSSVMQMIRQSSVPVIAIADEAGFEYGEFYSDGGLRTIGFEIAPAGAISTNAFSIDLHAADQPIFSVADGDGFEGISFDADGGLRTSSLNVGGGTGAIRTNLIEIAPSNDFDGAAFIDGDGFVGLVLGSSSNEDQPVIDDKAGPAPNYGGQLGDLKDALTDPLYQYLGLVLIGDSITWGSGASGGGVRTPRNESLLDPRNDGTSPSWANLLHQYLGRDYYESGLTATGWPGSPSGYAQFEYSRTVDLFVGAAPFSLSSAGASWALANASGSALGVVLNGTSANLSQTASLTFQTTGYGFSVVVQARADGGAYEIFVDGVSTGTFSSSTGVLGVPAAYGYVHTHTFASFKRAAKVELRLVPSASATVLSIEAVRITRTLRVTNNGIISTNTRQWVASLLADAIRTDDTFAFVQLGTNDLNLGASGTSPFGPSGVPDRITSIISTLKQAAIQPVLLCANAVTTTYAARMSLVRVGILEVARAERVDFIDQFALTRPDPAGALADDGTHPSDAGHLMMFNNIHSRIEGL